MESALQALVENGTIKSFEYTSGPNYKGESFCIIFNDDSRLMVFSQSLSNSQLSLFVEIR